MFSPTYRRNNSQKASLDGVGWQPQLAGFFLHFEKVVVGTPVLLGTKVGSQGETWTPRELAESGPRLSPSHTHLTLATCG